MWLQPNVISFRCRKPTLIIQTFNFRRKPSGTMKEQLPAFPPAKSELCSIERNSPARSLSCTNSIPHFMVLALGKFRVLHSRYVLLRNNLNVAPLLPLSSLLPSSPPCSLHSRCTGFLTSWNIPSILLFLDSLCLYILILDISMGQTLSSLDIC